MIVKPMILLSCWAIGSCKMASAWSLPIALTPYGQQVRPAPSRTAWGAPRSGSGQARRCVAATSAATAASPDTEAAEDPTQVCDGDTVVVVGASGGVGRLVTQSLAATGRYKLRGLVRSIDKAEKALGDIEGLELAEVNILDETSLGAAMRNAACVVACTGTTAFPSARWSGGNTPHAVDNLAVGNMVRVAVDPANHPGGGKLKRFVLLSSAGVERKDTFPFVILNAFGVLDAKAKGEETVRMAAKEAGFSYSIVRPGKIAGEPFTIFSRGIPIPAPLPEKADKNASKRMVSLRQGDDVAGSIDRSSMAAAFVQAVRQPGAKDKSFTVINIEGSDPTQEEWDQLYSNL